jgi:gamma-glutamylputrescine oxidase
VQLFEVSEVHRITAGRVQTSGGEVRAPFLVHATNGLGPHLTRKVAARVLPINNFIAVTEPLGDAAPMPDPVAVADGRFVVNYFWQTKDGRLVYGGGESYGKRHPVDIATRVRANLARVYPNLSEARFDYAWGGTLAVTATRLPFVADLGQGVFAAGGYSGHGLALSGLAGKALAEAIDGDGARLGVLAQLPVPALPGGRMFGGAMTTAGMMWAAMRDRLRG